MEGMDLEQDNDDLYLPRHLGECLKEDGSLDVDKYRRYMDHQDEVDELEEAKLLAMYDSDTGSGSGMDVEEDTAQTSKARKPRSPRRYQSIKPFYFNEKGEKVFLKPKQTHWYLCYVVSPILDCAKFQKKFRRRFRLPYKEFLATLEMMKEASHFVRWRSKDAVGQESSPLELMALGALRYLGRGLTFDDLEEYTAINEETHRQFFHIFIDWGSTNLFETFVKMPVTRQEYAKHRKEYSAGGLNGAGFSTDATNVVMWRCSHNLKQANMGWKQSHPARTYNMSCNHRRMILYTTKGHPSRWNDKTLAHFDEFLGQIHDGKILQDVSFYLYSWAGQVGNSEIEATKYNGAWGLVDNGYHKWACTQAPAKNNLLRSEERLSEWIESFRKDAECCFGILKGRWRVLKTGIRLEGSEAADKVWLTCCALHNFLLIADGNDEWDGAVGQNEVEEMRRMAPFALQRLSDNELREFGSREHERSACQEEQRQAAIRRQRGQLQEEENEEPDFVPGDDDHLTGSSQKLHPIYGGVLVNSLCYDDFRFRLVEHFDIQFRQNRIKWPERRSNDSNNNN
ncbi:Plant transposon protein [Seminavis robusta]|uniref:Plant transposon protein n=1 Tax=Seminavis robusta TaxID=568900 RepID=A0A9N8EDD2_9STRA|nr:Plant transposon protein [Seminavis robusta]|eukprot:Sro959_g224780.1 Plant transposon protein (568) ;mRNA; r:22387-24090